MLKTAQDSYSSAYDNISNIVKDSNSQIHSNTSSLMDNLNITIGEQLSEIANTIKTSEITTIIGDALDILDKVIGSANQNKGEPNDGVVYANSVVIEPNRLSLVAGESKTLKAKVYGENGKSATRQDVKWSSSDTKVATVSSSGKVTAKKFGSCTITATSTDSNKQKGTCKVTVQSKTGSILDDIQGGAQNHGSSSASAYLHSQGYGDITREQRVQILKEHGITDATVDNVTSVKYDALLKEKLKKKLATDWKNNLPKDTRSKEELAKLNQNAPTVYMAVKYGKRATESDMDRLAKILEFDSGGIPYSNWDGKKKTSLLNAFKAIGFSKGGRVGSVYMPINSQDVLRRNMDSGFVSANPGEYIYTERFMSNVMIPAIDAMDAFTSALSKNARSSPSSAPNIMIEQNIHVSGEVSNSTVKNLRKQLGDGLITDMTKYFKTELFKKGMK